MGKSAGETWGQCVEKLVLLLWGRVDEEGKPRDDPQVMSIAPQCTGEELVIKVRLSTLHPQMGTVARIHPKGTIYSQLST